MILVQSYMRIQKKWWPPSWGFNSSLISRCLDTKPWTLNWILKFMTLATKLDVDYTRAKKRQLVWYRFEHHVSQQIPEFTEEQGHFTTLNTHEASKWTLWFGTVMTNLSLLPFKPLVYTTVLSLFCCKLYLGLINATLNQLSVFSPGFFWTPNLIKLFISSETSAFFAFYAT